MTEFRKKELLIALQEIDDMLTLSLASLTYFHRDKDLKMLSQHWMMHFGRVWNLKQLANELQDEKAKIIINRDTKKPIRKPPNMFTTIFTQTKIWINNKP